MLDELFTHLLKKHSLNEIYEMDILELLRLSNLEHKGKTGNNEEKKKIKTDSLIEAFGV